MEDQTDCPLQPNTKAKRVLVQKIVVATIFLPFSTGAIAYLAEKAPKVVVVRALQPDTGEKCGLDPIPFS